MRIIRDILLAILLCLSSLDCLGETFSQDDALRQISQAAASINTMQCEFVQTKTLKLLGDKMVSEGIMYCQQPDKLLWQYKSPYAYTFILNGNKVLLKKGDRSDVIDVNQNKMFKEIARIMMNSVLGKCLSDKQDFKSSVAENGQIYIVTLLPQKKEMKQMFTKIILYYDRKLAMVTKVELHEKNGDFTQIQLKNIKKNTPINASLFKIN